MRILTLITCLLLSSGCSVQSSQLSGLVGLLKAPPADIALNSWSVKYVNYEAIVYPVNVPQGTLFSNKAGDQILFDGWSVRRINGMGLRGSDYQNSDIEGKRTFERGNRTLAVHRCDQWQQKQQSGKKQFSQYCEGVRAYSNSILVVEDGNINVIRQVVDDRFNVLTLSKIN